MCSPLPCCRRAWHVESTVTTENTEAGLRIIVEPPTRDWLSSPPVDIVFVHGLGGSPRETWTHRESKSFWPCWIPELEGLENSRIMTYGYSSHWERFWKPRVALDISDFAKGLVHELTSHYRDGGDVNLAMSVRLTSRPTQYLSLTAWAASLLRRALQKNTVAILFLGTPHRGAELANILKAAIKAVFNKKRYVDDLAPNSQTIKEINDGFASVIKKRVKLASLWETTGLPGLGIVVPQSSATMGFPGEIRVPLAGNHLTIVKFESRDDNDYRIISHTIRQMITEMRPTRHLLTFARRTDVTYPERGFLVPYDRNPHFIGRTEVLNEIRQRILEAKHHEFNHRIALYGLGGVGKTQIALQYCYTYRQLYNYVFWIGAKDRAGVLQGFYEIMAFLGYDQSFFQQMPEERVKWVMRWLEGRENWLMVFDNLDDLDAATLAIPGIDSGGHVLITTRNSDLASIPAEGIEIRTMTQSEGTEMLLKRASLGDNPATKVRNEAKLVVTELLDCLPLAIEQAAGFIASSENVLFDYREIFEYNRNSLLSLDLEGSRFHKESLTTTWRMSLSKLQNTSPDSIRLIEILSFLNGDDVPIEYLREGSSVSDMKLNVILTNLFVLQQAINGLLKYSLIRTWSGGQRIGIHRLVQIVVLDDVPLERLGIIHNALLEIGLAAMSTLQGSDDLVKLRKYSAQVKSTLQQVENHRLRCGLNTDELLNWRPLAERLGESYWRLGDFSDCLNLRERILSIVSRKLGILDEETLQIMFDVASTYSELGRYNDAASLHEETLRNRTRVLGREHANTLWSMSHLASTYSQQGFLAKAAELHEVTLNLRRKTCGDMHPDTLWSMNMLGSIYSKLGRLEEAEKLLMETLEARRKVLGLEDPDTLWTVALLAKTYVEMGRYAEAAELYETTVQSRTRQLGAQHPHTLISLRDLAATYCALGRIEQAIPLSQSALSMQVMMLGQKHPDTLLSTRIVAECYHTLGQTGTAVKMLEDVLQFQRDSQALGPEHPDTLITMQSLANCYSELGRTQDALDLLTAALETQKKVIGDEHPLTKHISKRMAAIDRKDASAKGKEQVIE